MKKMKRFVALALSVVMVLAMSVLASATTVNVDSELSGHTFVAYQIFTGTQATDSNELGDVEWGDGIKSTDFLTALQTDNTIKDKFSSCTDAKSVAAVLGTIESNSNEANIVAKIAFANKKGTGTQLTAGENNTLASGYYLIVDTTDTTDTTDMALNAALLQVTDDINITKKTDKPSVEKKVKENTKDVRDEGYGDKYNDVADYNMGDSVPFHLIGTVPDMSRYDTYKYVFHDTLSTGLTAPAKENVKVYLSSDKKKDDGNVDTDITDKFVVEVEGQEITVTCNDLKKISNIEQGQYIIVEYSAVLNQNAVVGLDGNENKVYLEYSNKPDQSGTGENTARTPEDKVIVFTYQLNATKVDGQNDTKLADAEFKLKNSDGKWAVVDGNGKVLRWVDDEKDASTLKSDSNGLFHVTGLDDGVYSLKETKAPAGYNLLDGEIEFTITATTANNQNWSEIAKDALTELEITVDNDTTKGSVSDGTVGITVKNNKGSQLPSTGGIGTTIFYIVGGILMVGAAVLLITKRRAEN